MAKSRKRMKVLEASRARRARVIKPGDKSKYALKKQQQNRGRFALGSPFVNGESYDATPVLVGGRLKHAQDRDEEHMLREYGHDPAEHLYYYQRYGYRPGEREWQEQQGQQERQAA